MTDKLKAIHDKIDRLRVDLIKEKPKYEQALYEISMDLFKYQEWQEQQSNTEWISVEDRLPENNTEILVFSTELQKSTSNTLVPLACFYKDKFRHYGDNVSQAWLDGIKITHWMPLPNNPK